MLINNYFRRFISLEIKSLRFREENPLEWFSIYMAIPKRRRYSPTGVTIKINLIDAGSFLTYYQNSQAISSSISAISAWVDANLVPPVSHCIISSEFPTFTQYNLHSSAHSKVISASKFSMISHFLWVNPSWHYFVSDQQTNNKKQITPKILKNSRVNFWVIQTW